jgi:hypothetical protein
MPRTLAKRSRSATWKVRKAKITRRRGSKSYIVTWLIATEPDRSVSSFSNFRMFEDFVCHPQAAYELLMPPALKTARLSSFAFAVGQ